MFSSNINSALAAGMFASSIFLALSPAVRAADGDAAVRESDQQNAREFASDAMITARVKTALLADKRVEGLRVAVATNNGVVTLNGVTDDAVQAEHAGKIAAAVEGVAAVNNEVVKAGQKMPEKTRGGARPADDEVITNEVKTALTADAGIDGRMIDVDTNRGVVTLSGQVASKDQLARAGKIAGATKGVNSVNNQLSVRNGSGQSEPQSQGAEARNNVRAQPSVAYELIAHRLFDSSPVARYRPLPPADASAFDRRQAPGSI